MSLQIIAYYPYCTHSAHDWNHICQLLIIKMMKKKAIDGYVVLSLLEFWCQAISVFIFNLRISFRLLPRKIDDCLIGINSNQLNFDMLFSRPSGY